MRRVNAISISLSAAGSRRSGWMLVFASAMGAGLLVPSTVPEADELAAATAILERSCLSCHNGAQRKGLLSLATRSETLAGGESGPALVSGNPGKSLLMTRPVHFRELFATLYQRLEIDVATTQFKDLAGRPQHLLGEYRPLPELIG